MLKCMWRAGMNHDAQEQRELEERELEASGAGGLVAILLDDGRLAQPVQPQTRRQVVHGLLP